jgi:hypothetical protein
MMIASETIVRAKSRRLMTAALVVVTMGLGGTSCANYLVREFIFEDESTVVLRGVTVGGSVRGTWVAMDSLADRGSDLRAPYWIYLSIASEDREWTRLEFTDVTFEDSLGNRRELEFGELRYNSRPCRCWGGADTLDGQTWSPFSVSGTAVLQRADGSSVAAPFVLRFRPILKESRKNRGWLMLMSV